MPETRNNLAKPRSTNFSFNCSLVHGHVESPTDGQLMVPIRGEPADGSPSPAHAKAVPRQGELVLQGAGTGPSAL